jgi:hypothetical protein
MSSLVTKIQWEKQFLTLRRILTCLGRAIAQAVSRWLPTAAVQGSKPDLGMWDLW